MEIAYTGRRRAGAAVEDELEARFLASRSWSRGRRRVAPLPAHARDARHLVDAAVLARMKPTAFLINTTRGPVVDEAALVDALRDGTIAGAGLDVYEREPVVHPGLLELENVVLLPHLGSATIETRTAMAVLAARNALAVLGGEPPLTPILHAGDRRA